MIEPSNTTKKKDKWDKFEIISKGILAIFVPVAITFYGIWSERQRSQESEANRRIQVIIQSLASRESAGADLKAKVFATLMEHYFKGKGDEKLLILELIALNLKDQFQLRPLFERIDAQLTNRDHKKELRRIVRNIASREIDRITGSGGDRCELDLKKNEQITAKCAPISLTLLDIQEDRIWVRTTPGDKDGFEVNYFDTPVTDYTKIGELIYSLVLSDIDVRKGSAKVQLITFPRHYYSGDNRLQLDQMLGEYLDRGDIALGR